MYNAADNETAISTSVFLTMFLIAIYPNEVFEKSDNLEPLERSLLEISAQLCVRFERILRTLVQKGDFNRVPAEMTVHFVPTLLEFMKRFYLWKKPSEERLAQRILDALNGLDDLRISLLGEEEEVGDHDPEKKRTLKEVEEQTSRLRQKMLNINSSEGGGAAALTLYDEKRVKRNEELRLSRRGGGNDSTTSPAHNDEQYAHELLLNPFFQLECKNLGILSEDRLVRKEALEEAFWKSLGGVKDLYAFPVSHHSWSRIMRLLVEIRDSFTSLADEPNALAMKELVDTELIRQQLEVQGCFGWGEWLVLVQEMRDIIKSAMMQHDKKKQTIIVIMNPEQQQRATEMQAGWDAMVSRTVAVHQQNESRLLCEALKFLMESVVVFRTDVMNER